MDTRPPPVGAPPSYVRVVNRVYRRSLRPVIFFVCGISLIWAVVLGVRFIQGMNDDFVTPTMRRYDLILAILYFVVAGIEVFGIVAAVLQRIAFARMYFLLSSIGAFFVFGLELFRLIIHFTTKNDEINACVQSYNGGTVDVIGAGSTTITLQQAQSLCNDSWNRGTWYDIGWLIVSTILAFLFASLAAAYYHQLRDPAFGRTTNAPSNNFRMGPWHQQPQAPYRQDPPFIPPYPGAPVLPYSQDQPPQYSGGDGDYAPEKEKGDHQLGKSLGGGASDSTVTLQPVSLHDDPTPADGREHVEGRV